MSRDPYAIVRDELLKEMRHVTTTFNTWKDACVNGSAPQINGAAAQVREHMEEATELLDEMQKANDIAEVDISKFHLDQDEMNSRKAFVSNYKRKLAEIKTDLAAPFDRTRSGAAGAPTKQQLWQDAIKKDNDNFLDNQEQSQDELFARHDQQFDVLHGNIRELGDMARVMGDETAAQNDLLDRMNEEAAETEDQIVAATRKVEKLIERMNGNCGWVCIGVLIAILVVISFVALAV